MSKVNQISKNENYTAVNVGSLELLANHTLIHPVNKQLVVGKVFLKDITDATGTEISFNTIPPKTELSYFHFHEQNEETYMILKGSGDFQVDDDSFPISEGSVIRVAPKGIRCMRNTSEEAMIYIVVQSKEKSLQQYTTEDGGRVEYERKWKSNND